MMHTKKRISTVFLFCLACSAMNAQEAVPAAGGNVSGNGGSASYTVGQVVYASYTGTNGSVAQGVQQAFEISVISSVEASYKLAISCTAYPNPTADNLNLKIDGIQDRRYRAILTDVNGKVLAVQDISGSEAIIPMAEFGAANYFLEVRDVASKSATNIKTFKIVKN